MNWKKHISIITLTLLGYCALAQSQQNQNIRTENPIIQQAAIDIKNQIEVYPNPAIEYIIIEIQNSDLVDTEFEMHSLIGNQINILPEEVGLNRYRIQVKDLSTGYYFLVVKDEISRYKRAFKFLKK